MSKVVVVSSLSLDGLMQAPGREDEDPRGGFTHGGWAGPYADEVMGRAMGEGMAHSGAILLGRRTYLDFYSVWPKRKDNPYTGVLNAAQKYVASRTLEAPLPWENSTLLKGDAADAVAVLRDEPGQDLVVLGSGDLVQSLMRRGLVDEYVLLIHPLVLGSGQRLFGDGAEYGGLELTHSVITTTGVMIGTYRPVRGGDPHSGAGILTA
jgi:dihydrofolate reductase